MKKAQGYKALLSIALGYLAQREHSTQELIGKLKTKTDQLELIPDVIAELTQKNYLNDERFAESYSRMRSARGYGKLRIQAELKERGIAVDSRFRGNDGGDGDEGGGSDIKKVREKKFGVALPKDIKEKSRQARFLQHRGFSFDEIKRVLNNDDDE
jgi:regulatory protein